MTQSFFKIFMLLYFYKAHYIVLNTIFELNINIHTEIHYGSKLKITTTHKNKLTDVV